LLDNRFQVFESPVRGLRDARVRFLIAQVEMLRCKLDRDRTLPEAATGPPEQLDSGDPDALDRIRCRRFHGGLLRHYYREAA